MVHCLRFLTTYRCNLDCRFCHREGAYGGLDQFFAADRFERLLTILLSHGLERLKFVGGEPFLSPQLEDYLAIASAVGVPDVGITSNGTATQRVKRVLNRFPSVAISISIPSFDEKEYEEITGVAALRHARRTLQYLHSIRKPHTVNIVVDRVSRLGALFAERLEALSQTTARIKLIVPCHSSYSHLAEEPTSIFQALTAYLIEQGCQLREWHLNQLTVDWKAGVELLIATPYCPGLCAALQAVAPTLRLTPDGVLKPCLLGDHSDVRLPHSDKAAEEDVVRQALIAARCCPAALNDASTSAMPSWRSLPQ